MLAVVSESQLRAMLEALALHSRKPGGLNTSPEPVDMGQLASRGARPYKAIIAAALGLGAVGVAGGVLLGARPDVPPSVRQPTQRDVEAATGTDVAVDNDLPEETTANPNLSRTDNQ